MSRIFRHIVLFVLVVFAFQAQAMEEPEDTVYFYGSWEQMLDMEPDTMIVAPLIDYFSPFEVYVKTTNKKFNKRIDKEYIAATICDTTWLINSNYLKKYFKGDAKKLHGYTPLFFNDITAYTICEEYMIAEVGDISYTVTSTYNYYIDFKQHKVIRIDEESLSNLLNEFPDLRRRYESMKDNNRQSVINYYFLEYIDRISDDPMQPYIIDQISPVDPYQN